MTLGLTSSGAIKIKTDGGLRAVGCACCGCLDDPKNIQIQINAPSSFNIYDSCEELTWSWNNSGFPPFSPIPNNCNAYSTDVEVLYIRGEGEGRSVEIGDGTISGNYEGYDLRFTSLANNIYKLTVYSFNYWSLGYAIATDYQVIDRRNTSDPSPLPSLIGNHSITLNGTECNSGWDITITIT